MLENQWMKKKSDIKGLRVAPQTDPATLHFFRTKLTLAA